jgi:hypothetical protein
MMTKDVKLNMRGDDDDDKMIERRLSSCVVQSKSDSHAWNVILNEVESFQSWEGIPITKRHES